MEQQITKSKVWYKKTWVIILAILLALAFIGRIVGKNETKSLNSLNTNQSDSISNNEVTKSPWDYVQDTDQMNGQLRYFASCVSTNKVEFKFPYDGGSSFTLTVRNMGKGNEIVLQVSKGQFMTSINSSESVRVKFDQGSVTNYSFNSADDGSSDVIFINNSAKFLSELKKAKKLMIESQFFNEGNKIIYFDVENLRWDK